MVTPRLLALVVIVACCGIAAAAPSLRRERAPTSSQPRSVLDNPAPPRWGGNDTQLAWSAVVRMTNQNTNPAHPTWMFNYSYNARLRASRYRHGVGQSTQVCQGLPPGLPAGSGTPCQVLNSADGFVYVSFPATGYCCNCSRVFTVRSDWLQDGGTTFLGASTVNGFKTLEWLKYGASPNHYYATADATRRPVRYYEHEDETRLKQWDFLEWSPATPPAAIFDPPASEDCPHVCETENCGILRSIFGP